MTFYSYLRGYIIKKENNKICLSAGDLSKHLGCRFLTQLDWAYAEERIQKKIYKDITLEAFQIRGLQHEEAYLKLLEKQGLSVLELGENRSQKSTISSMRKGYDIIAQATLSDENWLGRADILKKVALPSNWGDWSYEVVDTKLSQETKAGTILQLCLYSDLLANLQGIEPTFMTVVAPGFLTTKYPFKKYSAYFRTLRNSLLETIAQSPIDLNHPEKIYPNPVPQCDFCDWKMSCKKKRRDDDDLSIIADITKLQKKEIHELGIKTMTSFAHWDIPLDWRPNRGIKEHYFKIQEQAKIQYQSGLAQKVLYRLLPLQENQGLSKLPPPSLGDIFFDIEGDTFVGVQGLEYLLGFSYFEPSNQDQKLIYTSLWSKNAHEEKLAFEEFVRFVFERLQKYPDLHIYHYAPYEPGAIKRLMSKHATCETKVDTLLRTHIFVDLMRVVKQSMIVGVDRYSIKELEALYAFQRDVPLRDASSALHHLEFIYETEQVETLQPQISSVVEGYNRDDCFSTKELRDWLEQVRNGLIEKGEQIERPISSEEIKKKELSDEEKLVQNLQERLTKNIPENKEERSSEEQTLWVLSHLLGFHKREEKAKAWEYYRLSELTSEDLLYEKARIHSLTYIEDTGGTKKNPIAKYTFPPQIIDIKIGNQAKLVGGTNYGSFVSLDLVKNVVEIKKKAELPHAFSVFAFERIPSGDHFKSIKRLAEWVSKNGLDSTGHFQAARNLLQKKNQRLNLGISSENLQQKNESSVKAAVRITHQLDSGVLAIQGPPGSGKTYLASQVIASLVEQGKKVGVTALSHKVIHNLLEKTQEICDEKNLRVQCIHKDGKEKEDTSYHKSFVQATNTKYEDISKKIEAEEFTVIGGTSWMWSKEIFFELVDYLFIDEAGQFSLADAIAVAQAGKNLILLGDPQQLEKPIQATHPEETDISALQYFMGEHSVTISEEKGLFLKDTWRMHSDISSFISEQFYEGRLQSRVECSQQKIIGSSFAGTGIRYIPVEHQAHQSFSPEEVEKVSEIYHELISQASWLDHNRQRRKITYHDILIITPYNVQVRAIEVAIPQSRVGTVDKFQGQEAAVVIYSLATSNAEEAPRGMSFLYSQNRLNVAISRAKCMSIMVGNPEIFFPNCRNPIEMELANSFCRYQEEAKKEKS